MATSWLSPSRQLVAMDFGNTRRVTSIMTNCQKQGDALDKSLSLHRPSIPSTFFFLVFPYKLVRIDEIGNHMRQITSTVVTESSQAKSIFSNDNDTQRFFFFYNWLFHCRFFFLSPYLLTVVIRKAVIEIYALIKKRNAHFNQRHFFINTVRCVTLISISFLERDYVTSISINAVSNRRSRAAPVICSSCRYPRPG
jgi:hypothetical protein